ncbi:MAG: cysteine--tRNA ligase, partial [Candidatus Makaraimicrobium thalassicum]
KSLGNFYTVRDLVAEGFDPIAIRYVLISAHYRAPLNFTKEGLKAAWESVVRIRNFVRRMEEASAAEGASDYDPVKAVVEEFSKKFEEAVDDDLNMSRALAAVFDFMREANKLEPKGEAAGEAARAMRKADEILGILVPESSAEDDAEIEALVREREEARRARDFAKADRIRDELASRGIVVEDTKEGPRWYRK